jgi:hypothetical protein
MWLILTVVFAVLTFLSSIWFESIVPGLVFLALATVFMCITWKSKEKK